MVKILDRYLIKEFFKAIFLTLLVFIFIYDITNLFENIGRFLDKKAGFYNIFVYYVYFTPQIIILVMPVAFLLGIFFSLGFMARHNELLSLRALGISPIRILKPILLSGFIATLLLIFYNDLITPASIRKLNKWRTEKIYHIKLRGRQYFSNIEFIGKEGWTIYADFFNKKNKTIRNLDITAYKNQRIYKRIYARRAYWKDSLWVLKDVYIRKFIGEKVAIEVYDTLAFPLMLEKPDDFTRKRKRPEEMRLKELIAYVKRVEKAGGFALGERVEMQMRFAYPLISFILLLYGCPFALEVKKRGLAFGFGWGLVISFFYWGIIQIFKAYGIKGSLYPYLSAWLPNIIFGTFGFFLIIRAIKKL